MNRITTTDDDDVVARCVGVSDAAQADHAFVAPTLSPAARSALAALAAAMTAVADRWQADADVADEQTDTARSWVTDLVAVLTEK